MPIHQRGAGEATQRDVVGACFLGAGPSPSACALGAASSAPSEQGCLPSPAKVTVTDRLPRRPDDGDNHLPFTSTLPVSLSYQPQAPVLECPELGETLETL